MTMPAISCLAAASRCVAMHDKAEARFCGAFSLFTDLSLQNDDNGLMIAAEYAREAVETEFRHPDVAFAYDANGDVTAIDFETAFPDDQLAKLAAEVALLPKFEDRHLIIEAAALMLAQEAQPGELVDRVSKFRGGLIGVEALGLAGPGYGPL